MTPQRTYQLYGMPCVYCGFPAHHVEIYPQGRRVVHVDRFQNSPCESPLDSPRPSTMRPVVRDEIRNQHGRPARAS